MDGHDPRLWDGVRPEPATRTRPADDLFGDGQLLRAPRNGVRAFPSFPRVPGITCVPDATDASAHGSLCARGPGRSGGFGAQGRPGTPLGPAKNVVRLQMSQAVFPDGFAASSGRELWGRRGPVGPM